MIPMSTVYLINFFDYSVPSTNPDDTPLMCGLFKMIYSGHDWPMIYFSVTRLMIKHFSLELAVNVLGNNICR